jgi:hypothetical protein
LIEFAEGLLLSAAVGTGDLEGVVDGRFRVEGEVHGPNH